MAWLAAAAGAQQPVVAPAPAKPRTSLAPLAGLIDIQADDLSYDSVRKLVIAKGDIKVSRGTDSVSADYAEIDTKAEQVYARGNVAVQYQGATWKGEEATYNFKTGVGDFGAFEAYLPPYNVSATNSHRLSPHLMQLQGVTMTTCDLDDPQYSIRASSATIEDNNTVRAKNARFQFGPVPFFWMPYVKGDADTFANFEFTPGASSEMGPFLLTAYNYPINDTFMTHTHFDIRQKRGVAVGEDFSWKDPDGSDFAGMARSYYADDQNPWHDEEQQLEREDLIDSNRYWLHLGDVHNATDRDYLITELNYVSDPWVLHDFWDDEYQKNVQPENRMTLSHRGDRYTAGIGVNSRLNDFYENVNRLPEVFFEANRQQILETPFFYESENTLGYLEHVFPVEEAGSLSRTAGAPEFDAFRFDTAHMIYWPTRHFDFLSVIPRAGYRGTYFSKTKETYAVTNVVAVTNAAGAVVGTTNRVQRLTRDADAAWRNLPELGAETSFKAFGELYQGPTGIEEDEDLRHIAEPYADYTLVFEPDEDVQPESLWQFDEIDTLDRRNDVKVGLRNYLQTRRLKSTHDLVYVDVFTTLLMDPEQNEETLGDIGFDAETRPFTWLAWDFDGAFDTTNSSLRRFNTQVGVISEDVVTLDVEYRYERDKRSQIAGDLTMFPEQKWSGRVYARMNIDTSFVEEHSYYLVHRTRCLGLGIGVRIRPEEAANGDDDYSIWLKIWPLAFPAMYDIGAN
jgi:LPS-assembly protein